METCLGIDAFGSGGRSHVKAIKHHGKSAFTAAQEYELHHQALIFKFIVSGLPIPSHLVLPIWKSSGSSIGAASGGIHNQFPRCKWVSLFISFLSLFMC
ncbi:unnamed protein product [Ilex paraguariensis]|uniref:Growth-regulating factor n=1 Tax=Ilex paraguariensis TaxID=185542 RepID=A0ABC8SBE2_9AQUA